MNNKEPLIVMHNSYCGAYGIASYFLRTLAKIHQVMPQKLYVDWSDLTYYQNKCSVINVWDLLFYQPYVNTADENKYALIHQDSADGYTSNVLPRNFNDETRLLASQIIADKFVLKPEIYEAIESYYYANLRGKKCLAVHRRGLPYNGTYAMDNDTFNAKLLDVFTTNNFECVFFCSDNMLSKESTMSFLISNGIEAHTCDSDISKIMTSTARPWDADDSIDKNKLAKEIIIEMYLLSKCASIVSTFKAGASRVAMYINPHINEYDFNPEILG